MNWKEFGEYVKESVGQRFQYIITLVAVYGAITLVWWLLGFADFGAAISDWVEPRSVFLGLMIIYTIASFRTVGPEDRALILRFGRPIMQVDSGLAFVPLVVCTLRPYTKNVIQLELPGDPQFVWRLTGDDDRELPIGVGPNGQQILPPAGGQWVHAIRVTTASAETSLIKARDFGPPRWDPTVLDQAERQAQYDRAKTEFDNEENKLIADATAMKDNKDPLHGRLTIEPQIIVRFRIDDLVQFVQVIGEADEAKRQIEDTAIGVVQEEFARRTPALILAHINEITARINRALEMLIGERPEPHTGDRHEPWGIVLSNAQLKLVGLTKTINVAMANARDASFKAGQDAALGTGEGDRIKNKLDKETQAFKERGELLNNNEGARHVANLAAMVSATATNTKIVVSGNNPASAMLSLAAAGKEVLTTSQPPEPTP